MKKQCGRILSLETISLPVPILRYMEWVLVKYPNNTSEDQLIEQLKIYLHQILEFAKSCNIRQIKIPTQAYWNKLERVSFTKSVYYMNINTASLTRLVCKKFPVKEIKNTAIIKDLITQTFKYHCEYKSIYFTCEVKKRVALFIDNANKAINNKEAFCFAAKTDGQFAAFLYGEHSEYDSYGKEGCVDELFVTESYRGGGIGKCLLQAAGKKFLRKDFQTTGLFVGTDEKALGFYEKLGFKRVFVNWVKNL